MADLTKLVYEKVKDYDIEGAKIFMKKFGDNVKTEHETIKFFIENHLANNDDEAKECLEEMTREIYKFRNINSIQLTILLTPCYFGLTKLKNLQNETTYKIKKYETPDMLI